MAELQRDGNKKSRSSVKRAADETQVRITHPERVVFKKLGLTKGDVAAYYATVAERMLPELANRPLSLLRCPDGVGKECFFQKHITQNVGAHVQRVRIRENSGTGIYFSVSDAAGLLELVQMNALEFHPWGAHADDVEHCDRIVFDLDPDRRLEWKRMIAAARRQSAARENRTRIVRAHLGRQGPACRRAALSSRGVGGCARVQWRICQDDERTETCRIRRDRRREEPPRPDFHRLAAQRPGRDERRLVFVARAARRRHRDASIMDPARARDVGRRVHDRARTQAAAASGRSLEENRQHPAEAAEGLTFAESGALKRQKTAPISQRGFPWIFHTHDQILR